MKGEKRLHILEYLEKSGLALEELFFIFTVPYGTSFHRAEYLLRKWRQKRDRLEENRKEKQRFNDFVYRLRKDGLIGESPEASNNSQFSLSAKGKEILEKLRERKTNSLPGARYETEGEDLLKIIIFDIPEDKKRHREWLREVLKNLNFTMLQKSVWSGKNKVPQSFLSDLKKLQLLECVEIFAISKTGSLKKID